MQNEWKSLKKNIFIIELKKFNSIPLVSQKHKPKLDQFLE